MKKIIICLFVLFGPMAQAQLWRDDLDAALSAANVNNKYVLLYFSVEDACQSCSELEKNVFSSALFGEFASKNFIMVKEDFGGGESPADKAKNLLIVEKYNKDGFFPLVVILNKDGKVIKKTGPYNNESAETYIRLLESL